MCPGNFSIIKHEKLKLKLNVLSIEKIKNSYFVSIKFYNCQ